MAALLNSVLSQRVVDVRLHTRHVSLLSVRNLYKRYKENGLFTRRPGSGRNRVTSDRFTTTVSLRNRRLNTFQLPQKLRVVINAVVSYSTIRSKIGGTCIGTDHWSAVTFDRTSLQMNQN